MTAPAPATSRPLARRMTGGAVWLAMGLSLAYLTVMAGLMWLFENALALEEVGEALGDPRRLNLWLLIIFSAILIFMFAAWSLQRISAPLPPVSLEGASPASGAQASSRAGWLLLSVLAALLLGTGGYVLREQERTIEAAQFRQLSMIGLTKSRVAARWVSERKRDVLALLENRDFVANVQALVERKRAPGSDDRMPALEALVRANDFVGAVIVDRSGRTLFSEPDDLNVRQACQLRARANGIDRANPLDMTRAFAAEAGAPRVDAVGHVFADQEGTATHIATVCVRIDLVDRLLPALSVWPMPAQTGSVWLGRFDGDDVLVLNTPREGAERWTLHRQPAARERWQAAVRSTQAGELHERDLADGRTMLRAAFEVEGTPWLIVARMDEDEADRLQSHGQRRAAVAAGFAFVFAVAVAMLGWARSSARAASFDAERSVMFQRLQDLAYYDSLTGLPRRPLTEDRLQVAIAQAKRDNGSVGVLFIDLDGFKAVNDRYGHAAGDELLQFVADQLSGRLREGDTVGRIGGDEFLVVLPGCGDAAALARLGDTFARAAKVSFDWEGQRLSVGASVGGALHPHHGGDAAAMTAAADKAMYRAKQAGGGYASA